jgi:hypothetical protein
VRDQLAEPSTQTVLLGALADALAELAAIGTLEDFERCR